jgi:DNA-binding response OmpR family regulator
MPRILVVDDQTDVRAMICMVLRVNRFDVVEADSIKAGLRAFAEQDYDAAVVDIFLKDENGLDLIAALRRKKPDLPIVAVSGMTTLEAVARSSELPNLVCLQKPFRPVDLLHAIEAAGGSVPPFGKILRQNKNAPANRGV